jgi:antitoxin component YwqK of YwqJK toxin-antitoxin module
MNQRNKYGNRDGNWEDHYFNGQLSYKGTFLNGEPDGPWESYRDNGKLLYKGSFINGIQIGYWIYQYETEFHL